jgi:hypothetical protein
MTEVPLALRLLETGEVETRRVISISLYYPPTSTCATELMNLMK